MSLHICRFWEVCDAGVCRHSTPHEAYGDCQIPAQDCKNCRPATNEEIESETTKTHNQKEIE